MKSRIKKLEEQVDVLTQRVAQLEMKTAHERQKQVDIQPSRPVPLTRVKKKPPGTLDVVAFRDTTENKRRILEVKHNLKGVIPKNNRSTVFVIAFTSGARVSTTLEDVEIAKRLRAEYDTVILVVYTAHNSRVGTPDSLSPYVDYTASIRVDDQLVLSRATAENIYEWQNMINVYMFR